MLWNDTIFIFIYFFFNFLDLIVQMKLSNKMFLCVVFFDNLYILTYWLDVKPRLSMICICQWKHPTRVWRKTKLVKNIEQVDQYKHRDSEERKIHKRTKKHNWNWYLYTIRSDGSMFSMWIIFFLKPFELKRM